MEIFKVFNFNTLFTISSRSDVCVGEGVGLGVGESEGSFVVEAVGEVVVGSVEGNCVDGEADGCVGDSVQSWTLYNAQRS